MIDVPPVGERANPCTLNDMDGAQAAAGGPTAASASRTGRGVNSDLSQRCATMPARNRRGRSPDPAGLHARSGEESE